MSEILAPGNAVITSMKRFRDSVVDSYCRNYRTLAVQGMNQLEGELGACPQNAHAKQCAFSIVAILDSFCDVFEDEVSRHNAVIDFFLEVTEHVDIVDQSKDDQRFLPRFGTVRLAEGIGEPNNGIRIGHWEARKLEPSDLVAAFIADLAKDTSTLVSESVDRTSKHIAALEVSPTNDDYVYDFAESLPLAEDLDVKTGGRSRRCGHVSGNGFRRQINSLVESRFQNTNSSHLYLRAAGSNRYLKDLKLEALRLVNYVQSHGCDGESAPLGQFSTRITGAEDSALHANQIRLTELNKQIAEVAVELESALTELAEQELAPCVEAMRRRERRIPQEQTAYTVSALANRYVTRLGNALRTNNDLTHLLIDYSSVPEGQYRRPDQPAIEEKLDATVLVDHSGTRVFGVRVAGRDTTFVNVESVMESFETYVLEAVNDWQKARTAQVWAM